MLDDYKVYRLWFDFTNWTIKKLDTFPRSVRYSFSNRIMNISLDIMQNIIYSVYKKDRLTKLLETNLMLEVLRSLWRMSFDNKWISLKNYEFVSENIQEFGSMKTKTFLFRRNK